MTNPEEHTLNLSASPERVDQDEVPSPAHLPGTVDGATPQLEETPLDPTDVLLDEILQELVLDRMGSYFEEISSVEMSSVELSSVEMNSVETSSVEFSSVETSSVDTSSSVDDTSPEMSMIEEAGLLTSLRQKIAKAYPQMCADKLCISPCQVHLGVKGQNQPIIHSSQKRWQLNYLLCHTVGVSKFDATSCLLWLKQPANYWTSPLLLLVMAAHFFQNRLF